MISSHVALPTVILICPGHPFPLGHAALVAAVSSTLVALAFSVALRKSLLLHPLLLYEWAVSGALCSLGWVLGAALLQIVFSERLQLAKLGDPDPNAPLLSELAGSNTFMQVRDPTRPAASEQDKGCIRMHFDSYLKSALCSTTNDAKDLTSCETRQRSHVPPMIQPATGPKPAPRLARQRPVKNQRTSADLIDRDLNRNGFLVRTAAAHRKLGA
jgi:hypothetical protein